MNILEMHIDVVLMIKLLDQEVTAQALEHIKNGVFSHL